MGKEEGEDEEGGKAAVAAAMQGVRQQSKDGEKEKNGGKVGRVPKKP